MSASGSKSTRPLPPPALAALQSVDVVAADAANLLGGLQGALQSVRPCSLYFLHAPCFSHRTAHALSLAALSQLSRCSVEHMSVYRDAAQHTRDAIDESVTAGRSFIDKCAQLDERMHEVERIAAQLGDVDRALTALEESFDAGGIPRLPQQNTMR